MTVTATLSDGMKWGSMPAGWVKVDDVTATYAIALVGTSCTEVEPVAPSVKEAVCTGGVLVPPTFELAQTDRITYTVNR